MDNYLTIDLDRLRATGAVDFFDTPRGKEVASIVAKRMADEIEAEVIASLSCPK